MKDSKVIANASMLRAAQIIADDCSSGDVSPFSSSHILLDTDGRIYALTQSCVFRSRVAFECHDFSICADPQLKVMTKPFKLSMSHRIDTGDDDGSFCFNFPDESLDRCETTGHLSNTLGNPSGASFFGIRIQRDIDHFNEKFELSKKLFSDFNPDEPTLDALHIPPYLLKAVGECGSIPMRLLPPKVEPTIFETSAAMAKLTIPYIGEFIFKSASHYFDNEYSFESK